MTPGPRRIGGTTWLAVAVAVLLPALAWMQYDWVTQLAAADRDRRERTLRTAASQFTAAIDTELSRIGGSLQLDGAMVERQDWDAYALRYAGATANQSPSLVRGVWYVETRSRARPRRRRAAACSRQWMPRAARPLRRRAAGPTTWPLVRSRLLKQTADGRPARRRSA